jgi:large-conductance mechanosensitive channel
MIKTYSKTKKSVQASAPAKPSQEDLLAEIRDLLKK